MKNLNKTLGIIALAAIIGFTMTACSGKKDSGGSSSSGSSASASSAPAVDVSQQTIDKIGGFPEKRWEKEGQSSTYMAFNNGNKQLGYKFAIEGMEKAYLWVWDVKDTTVIIWRFGEVNILTATLENSAFTFNVALSNGDKTMTVSGLTGEYAGGNGTYNLVE